MIELYVAACEIEAKALDLNKAETKYVRDVSQDGKTPEQMWVEQRVMKKEMGL